MWAEIGTNPWNTWVSAAGILFLLVVNGGAFLLFGLDKRRAKLGKWRIRERTLWLLAFAGGALGALAGMRCFHHKTKHRSFAIGIPVLCVLQTAGVLVWIARL